MTFIFTQYSFCNSFWHGLITNTKNAPKGHKNMELVIHKWWKSEISAFVKKSQNVAERQHNLAPSHDAMTATFRGSESTPGSLSSELVLRPARAGAWGRPGCGHSPCPGRCCPGGSGGRCQRWGSRQEPASQTASHGLGVCLPLLKTPW